MCQHSITYYTDNGSNIRSHLNLGPSIGTNLDYDYNLIQCEGIACKPAQYIVTSLQTDCIVMLLK